MTNFIGLDPGKGGGIAVIDADGHFVAAHPMPDSERDVLELLRAYPDSRAVLESVSASPGWGIVSCFTFGKGYGGLRMALVATGIPFDEVRPQKWQRVLGCLTKGDKNISKARAQQLFPSVKRITHKTADALLLAEFARRLEVRP